MYCKKCGTNNTDNMRFCKKCGAELLVTSTESTKNEKSLNENKNKNIIILISVIFGIIITALVIVIVVMARKNSVLDAYETIAGQYQDALQEIASAAEDYSLGNNDVFETTQASIGALEDKSVSETTQMPTNSIGVSTDPNYENAPSYNVKCSLDKASDFSWNLTNGVLTVSGNGTTPRYNSKDGGWFETPWWNDIDSVNKIVVNEGITAITECSFDFMWNATEICIPSTIQYLEYWALWGADQLKIINYNGTKAQWNAIEKDRSWYSGSEEYKVVCIDGTLKRSLTPCCGDNATYTIDNGVLTIYGTGAIDWYGNGGQPWEYDSTIKEINVEEGITELGGYCFSMLSSLNTVNLPASIKTIGYGAIGYNESLNTINYGGTSSDWQKIEFENSWDAESNNYEIVCTDGVISTQIVVTPR